jgi:hypothetical protein
MADVISGIKIPDSKIAREAAELVRQHETEMRVCVRCDEGYPREPKIRL